MNSSLPPNHSVDEILRELEERFGVSSKKSPHHNKKKSFSNFIKRLTQNQILGGLTLMLMVVGVVAGYYLGNEPQDIRKQAYPDGDPRNTATPVVPTSVPPTAAPTTPPDDGHVVTCPETDYKGYQCSSGCAGKVGDSCGTANAPGHCEAQIILGCGAFGITCICAYDPPPSNPCSTKPGGVCVAPGSGCPVGKRADGLCSGAGSGPVCCIPNPISTVRPTSIVSSPTNIPPTNVPATNIPATIAPTTFIQPTAVPPTQIVMASSTPLRTATPLRTSTPSRTPTPSRTFTPSRTPTNTATASNTRTPTITRTPTNTPTPSRTFTPSNTPTPSRTFTPSRTPTPSRTITPGGPTLTPVPSATFTTVMGPVCANVAMQNISSLTLDAAPKIGDNVTLRCADVTGASYYEFSMRLPNGNREYRNASSVTTVSQPFTIAMPGSHIALCRPCNSNGCAPWEM